VPAFSTWKNLKNFSFLKLKKLDKNRAVSILLVPLLRMHFGANQKNIRHHDHGEHLIFEN